ncbi:MAG: deoxyribodipyrimidine photo-lyase [Bryobacter sp.]
MVEAAARGPVLPLYIVEPEAYTAPDYSAAHWQFTRESLLELREALAALGMPLVLRQGEAVRVLQSLPIARLWAHEETGNGVTYARDRRVRRWARETGIPFVEFPANGVVRRLANRNGWSKIWEERMAEPILAAPALRPSTVELGHIPTERELGLSPLSFTDPQLGGTRAAKEVLSSFLTQRGEHYHKELSSPLTAEHACSRLSPYLAYGNLSTKQVVQATRAALARNGWKAALRAFDGRLHWRCHFMQKLEDEPRIEFENFVRAYDGMREPYFDAERFAAWKEGRTGYPMVDACQRMLRAKGWINFRMRAMLVSFASYHLWLHWREPALHLAKLFVDYEPGIHYSQFQMQSATTGINTIRIYSPAKQQEDHDPAGIFLRRWIPEYGTPAYPPPIVDHKEAIALARQRLGEFRRKTESREEARAVMAKHGSRKRNPATKRKKASTPAQPALFDQLGESGA